MRPVEARASRDPMNNGPILDPALFPTEPLLDPSSPLPRYAQVRDWLAGQIRSGALTPGAKLPAEKDWAPSLGVSQMTLNHAIQSLVKEGVIVREVGRGTFVANGERSRPQAHIGLVLHWRQESDGGHYGTHILQGIYRSAANHPARFAFAWGSDVETAGADYYVEMARGMLADGILLVMPPADALPHILALRDSGLPFVVVGASWKGQAVPSVDFDNAGGTEQAVRHLLELGHRRIGLINGALYLRSSQARTDTFRRVLREEGVRFDPGWEITSSTFQMDGGSTAGLRSLLSSDRAPTAFYAAGYYLSMQAVDILQGLGLRIPEDVSVVGFGDTFPAAYLNPPLTTVRHPIEELGERAAERLIEGVAAGSVSRTAETLPVEFVVRRSTAPPAPVIALPTGTMDNPTDRGPGR